MWCLTHRHAYIVLWGVSCQRHQPKGLKCLAFRLLTPGIIRGDVGSSCIHRWWRQHWAAEMSSFQALWLVTSAGHPFRDAGQTSSSSFVERIVFGRLSTPVGRSLIQSRPRFTHHGVYQEYISDWLVNQNIQRQFFLQSTHQPNKCHESSSEFTALLWIY